MCKKSYLPAPFESFERTKSERRKIQNTLRGLPRNIVQRIDFPSHCHKRSRCLSGLCTTCNRNYRRSFLRFARDEKLSDLKWYFVTVIVRGWDIPLGDYTPFGDLRDHPVIQRILQRFRRTAKAGLLVFGSIENVYKTVDGVPVGKAFHLHMMVSGLSKKTIKECLSIPEVLSAPSDRPVLIRSVRRETKDAVRRETRDFVKSASYAIKQPFFEERRSSTSSRKFRRFPTKLALGELLSNYGSHPVGARAFFIGFRCDQGHFSLTTNVKSVIARKLARRAGRSNKTHRKTK
ncbi:hypothetical protein [Brucella anthropi]|uniref:hypothetical protein n=1 Tax=Brucella anthropi TaxID=529 RepID=UPI00124DB119|nr:hypothetical protein [Brucella anthropi]KAB2728002.1 hypothetical protein F9K76_00665 [Brucella anthropi]KAB2745174.1 hypothetical protein F9K74_00615 [Brucella anthropi]KAB2805599.1 hypothetical protein F9K83_00615 [Brucella anthropi]